MQADPDKVPRLFRPLLALIEVDVGDLQALAVNCSGNNATHNAPFLVITSAQSLAVCVLPVRLNGCIYGAAADKESPALSRAFVWLAGR
jgi:hypothetical protein